MRGYCLNKNAPAQRGCAKSEGDYNLNCEIVKRDLIHPAILYMGNERQKPESIVVLLPTERLALLTLSVNLNTSTPDVVREYIRLFKQNDYASSMEKAIHRLVDALPCNAQIEDVLLKVTAINRLYSTNLYIVYPMNNKPLSCPPDRSRFPQMGISLISW